MFGAWWQGRYKREVDRHKERRDETHDGAVAGFQSLPWDCLARVESSRRKFQLITDHRLFVWWVLLGA